MLNKREFLGDNKCFEACSLCLMPIRETQIIQERLNSLRVRFVSAPDYTPQTGADLVRRLREQVGEMEIMLEPVDTIPRSSNGKFRAVISLL